MGNSVALQNRLLPLYGQLCRLSSASRRQDMLDAIEARRRAGIERALLLCTGTRCDAFERIPQHRIARAPPIDRVIAFEHRALRPECIDAGRSEEHTSELQSLMRISNAVFGLKKKKENTNS